MNALRAKDELPLLTRWEIAVLLALAKGQMTGYEVGVQCLEDMAGEAKPSNGTLYPILRRLEKADLIQSLEPGKGRPGRTARSYRLTRAGRMMLGWELSTYRRLVRLGEGRL